MSRAIDIRRDVDVLRVGTLLPDGDMDPPLPLGYVEHVLSACHGEQARAMAHHLLDHPSCIMRASEGPPYGNTRIERTIYVLKDPELRDQAEAYESAAFRRGLSAANTAIREAAARYAAQSGCCAGVIASALHDAAREVLTRRDTERQTP